MASTTTPRSRQAHVGAPEQRVPLQPLAIDLESERLRGQGQLLQAVLVKQHGDVDVRSRPRAPPGSDGDCADDHVGDSAGLEQRDESNQGVVQLGGDGGVGSATRAQSVDRLVVGVEQLGDGASPPLGLLMQTSEREAHQLEHEPQSVLGRCRRRLACLRRDEMQVPEPAWGGDHGAPGGGALDGWGDILSRF